MFFKKKAPTPVFFSAIIAAAGSSTRMNGINKQLLMLDGMPAVIRSIQAVSEYVDEVIVVTSQENIAIFYDLVREYSLIKVKNIVCGSSTRQQSVFEGIKSSSEHTDYFLIHDGARPFVSEKVIQCCMDDAVKYSACTAGVKVKDTIKSCNTDGFVDKTLDRNALYSIQTPQIFKADIYKKAMELALCESLDFTDDCQLIENIGVPVFISQGDYINIKITTPEDLLIANAILNS